MLVYLKMVIVVALPVGERIILRAKNSCVIHPLESGDFSRFLFFFLFFFVIFQMLFFFLFFPQFLLL